MSEMLDLQIRRYVETANLKQRVDQLSIEPHLAFSKQCPTEVVDVILHALENKWIWIAHAGAEHE